MKLESLPDDRICVTQGRDFIVLDPAEAQELYEFLGQHLVKKGFKKGDCVRLRASIMPGADGWYFGISPETFSIMRDSEGVVVAEQSGGGNCDICFTCISKSYFIPVDWLIPVPSPQSQKEIP
jgi:hypothetical protein